MVVWLYGRTVVRSYGHTVVWSYGRTSKFFQLDGLLLFCIIMGLCSASSAYNETVFGLFWNQKLKQLPNELNSVNSAKNPLYQKPILELSTCI